MSMTKQELQERRSKLQRIREIVSDALRDDRDSFDYSELRGVLDLEICDIESRLDAVVGLEQGTHIEVKIALGVAAGGAWRALGGSVYHEPYLRECVSVLQGGARQSWVTATVRKPVSTEPRTIPGCLSDM